MFCFARFVSDLEMQMRVMELSAKISETVEKLSLVYSAMNA